MHRDDILRMAHEAGWSGVFVEWAKQPDEQFPVEKSLPVPVTMEQIERFAALVAAAERDKIQAGYERLAFLHTETMAELVRVQRHLDCISANWWELLKHRIKTILGIKAKEDT